MVEVTAQREKSRLVWTSLGIFNVLLPFLENVETNKLQALNQFSYNVLVGRVMTQISLIPPAMLTWPQGSRFSMTLFEYDGQAGRNNAQHMEWFTDLRFNFDVTAICQVKASSSVYGLRHDTDPAIFHEYTNIIKGSATEIEIK